MSPYLISLVFFKSDGFEGLALFSRIAPVSFLQSLASTFCLLFLSFFGAFGILAVRLRLPSRWVPAFEFMCLVPSFLPTIFLIVCTLSVFSEYPFNINGVVLLHVLSQIGVCSLVISRIVQDRLTGYYRYIMTVTDSFTQFVRLTLPVVRRDLIYLSLFYLVYFLTSFSIPLIIAGSSYSTLEVVIHQQVSIDLNWSLASALIFWQLVMVILLMHSLSYFRHSSEDFPILEKQDGFIDYPKLMSFVLLPMAPAGLIVLGFCMSFPNGLSTLQSQPELTGHAFYYFFNSLYLGFLTAGLTFLSLTFICQFFFESSLSSFLKYFITPSYVALSFGMFLIFKPIGEGLQVAPLTLTLCIAFLPTVIRMGFVPRLESLKEQWEMAQLLGGSRWVTFKTVMFPQMAPSIGFLSGLVGVWSVGDYAMSEVISATDFNLGMWIQSLVDQYRWDAAVVLSSLILIAGMMVFLFFWSFSYVANKELT